MINQKKKLISKSIFLLTFIFLITLTSSLTLAQDLPVNPDKITNLSTNIQDTAAKWSTTNFSWIQEQWQIKLLENPIINKIHTFLSDHQLPFKIILAEPYSMSVYFFFVLVFWFWFWLHISSILRFMPQFTQKPALAYLAAIPATMILAHLSIITVLINFLGDFIFSRKSKWVRIGLMVLTFAALAITYMISQVMQKKAKEKAEKERKKEAEQAQKETIAFSEGLKKGAKIE